MNANAHEQQISKQFFRFLFSIVAAGFIELRMITPGGAVQEFFRVTDPVAAATRALELRDGADVYVGVAPRDRESGSGTDVTAVAAIWADIDSDEGRAGLAEFPLKPSMAVGSGSGENLHVYWMLDRQISPTEAERLMKALAARIKSDGRVTDRARILRVPGTFNHKHQVPVLVTLERSSEKRYSVDEVRQALDVGAAEGADQVGEGVDIVGRAMIDAGTTSDPVARVLDSLEGVRGRGGQWTALCPAHDDVHPSLSVSEGNNGRCLLKCHAGCATDEVVRCIGLQMTDLFEGSEAKRSASRLVELVQRDGLEVFHQGELPFATMTVEGRLRTWGINSPELARELRRVQYVHTGEAVGRAVLEEAVATLGARASFEGEERTVHHRVAEVDGRLFIDCGDDSGEVIEITAKGWRLTANPGIHFVREKDDLPFPKPTRGGTLNELRALTNCANEANFKVFVASILMCFHPAGPYPLIYITGEQGSAKSTHSRMVASLADPRKAPLSIGQPGTRDLVAGASRVRLLGFDNMSPLSRKFSDALCQLLTGGGHRARELFTDGGQFVLEMRLAVQMNGIGNVVKRPDLQERTAMIELKSIPPEKRQPEEAFLRSWDEALPRVFGALLDGISTALANRSTVELDGYPRMADFALWTEAAAPAFGWDPGDFIAALEGGQAELVEDTIDGHPEIEALLRYISELGHFDGTAQELLAALSQKVHDEERGRYWPTQPDQLSKRLEEFRPLLRARGIEFDKRRKGGGNRIRTIHIYRIGDAGTSGDEQR